jgi:tetratricopeptide (TPR) repeat protein
MNDQPASRVAPFSLPPAPAGLTGAVKAWSQAVVIPTYPPMPAETLPMFLGKRVYQGSSGKVYPLPFVDRISEKKVDRAWEAVHLENEYVRLMILPELGGRIHVGLDKTNGYDFFYRQNVIKPALVGLAGPWISGGVEFNWPQHHRPSTFMRTDWEIETDEEGSVTVWCSEHEPMNRMKGMHGICLHPGRSVIELKVRLYNRTEFVQTFLWWANVAVKVHERYQSFFPPDVHYVADHAKRAMSRFPLCEGVYYGVDYGGAAGKMPIAKCQLPNDRWADGTRKKFVPPVVDGQRMYAANDLSWYANIPVPTSYMAMGSREGFFGGYDHAAEAGIVHVADHHIAPGKKQWTWGNHAFGYAWDRNLSEDEAPYIELMAGVFTDNQPDFSYLMPGETRAWSQYWYPIQKIGPVQKANRSEALSVQVQGDCVRVGLAVTCAWEGARVKVMRGDVTLQEWTADLSPSTPLIREFLMDGVKETELRVSVWHGEREVLAYQPVAIVECPVPEPARAPGLPADVGSIEELYLIGVHLEQYRHATRMPEEYWREALRREPGDVRCNAAMGWWHVRRGEFEKGVEHFRQAIATLTQFNPNPREGEAYYGLGVALRHLGRDDEAFEAFSKATWNGPWQAASSAEMGEICARRGQWWEAYKHLGEWAGRSKFSPLGTLSQRLMLRKKMYPAAPARLEEERPAYGQLDPAFGFFYEGSLTCDGQTRLDVALYCARLGLHEEAHAALKEAETALGQGFVPLVHYYRAHLLEKLNRRDEAARERAVAATAAPDYCFPARLEELAILREAIARNPQDARARYYLGTWMYDRKRREEAIGLWEKAVRLEPSLAVAWRNLGIAYHNVHHDAAAAKGAYQRAVQHDPTSGRIFYERDQLWKRTGVPAAERLAELESRLDLVRQRDDLAVEYCTLLNMLQRHEEALEILKERRFQPWEGGEGLVLGQWWRTHVALGRRALWQRKSAEALTWFEEGLSGAENLGESKHLLANMSELHYWTGMAQRAAGRAAESRRHLAIAAESSGDFRDMSVCAYSETSYFSGLALLELDRGCEAQRLFEGMLAYARDLAATPARIDYFATSLPAMLLFDVDLQERQQQQARLLEGLARWGVADRQESRRLLKDVLQADPNHAVAADLLASMDWSPIGP